MTSVARTAALLRYTPRLASNWPVRAPYTTLPGAVCSVDLRGFTALTRRLSERAPHGAEEVTRLVDSCFAQLVDIIEVHGGDVISFGGDAVLALFADESEPQRAAACAIALR